MIKYNRNPIISLLAVSLCLIGFGQAFGAEGNTSNLLPEGVVIKDVFQPGIGEPIGKISDVQGQAVIIHANAVEGYPAAKNLDLYKNDTLVTMDGGHLGFSLNDGSFMTLSPRTRLQVNKSVYAPGQKTRSSFLDLGFGKARFIVQKLVDAKHSEFKVKTKTSVAGVRGSDFIIFASEEITEITALTDTLLEVVSLATPEAPAMVLNDFEQTRVGTGAAPTEPRKLEAEEVDRLMKEFLIQPPEMSETAEFQPVQKSDAGGGDGGDVGEGGAAPPVFEVAGEDLIVPGPVEKPMGVAGGPVVEPMGQAPQMQRELQQVQDIQAQVVEKKSEEVIVEEVVNLPDFPELPDM